MIAGSERPPTGTPDPTPADVAISVLHDDRQVAKQIREDLPEDISVFLYTERKADTAGRDGLELFSGVFRIARLCLVLYREEWGEVGYTRVEEDAIKDRLKGEGPDFLLLVRFGEVDELPPWFPQWDQWIDYYAEGAGGVADAVVSKLRELERGGSPWRRITRRGVEHRPLPVSWYQRHEGGVSTMQVTLVEPEVCDGCRENVLFRPLVRVQLWGSDDGISTEEQFCPPCAQRRELTVMIPPGMDREIAHGENNPTLKEHIDRLLRSEGGGVLESLSSDEEIRSHGVSNVGSSAVSDRIALLPRDGGKDYPEIEVFYSELEEASALGEVQLFEFLKHRVLEILRE